MRLMGTAQPASQERGEQQQDYQKKTAHVDQRDQCRHPFGNMCDNWRRRR